MAKYLNEDGVGLMLQNINNHINTKLSNYLPKTTIKTINGTSILGEGDISIPDEVELIEISGDMLADEPTYTATEAQAIIDAYNANKLIAIKCGTRINFGKGWFIPNISIRTQSGISQIFLSSILGNYYIEHRITYDTSAGTVSTTTQSLIDLSEIGGSSEGGSSMYAYGTCSTAAGTGTKVVDLTDTNFTVSTGSIVAVKFTYANSVATTSLQLKVGDVTAQIKYLNTTFLSNQHWSAGSVVEFIYDGSAWQVLGTIKDNVGSDTKVNQTITTTNSTYPLLFSATANKSTSSADAARFSSNLKYNPSTQSLLFPAATSGKSVNIGLGTKPSGTYNGLVIYNAGGSQSDADFINICAADVFIRKADGSMGGTINAELTGASSFSRDAGSNWYGTCSSLASASTKVVDLCNIILGEGSRVWINFTNGNTYTGEQVTMSITTANGSSVSTVLDFYNFIGVDTGGVGLADYTAGISMLPGAYEFIYLDSKLKYTGNYVADRAPEILVKSAITGTGAAITFELVKNMHTVFNIGTRPRALELTIPSASETYSCEFTTGVGSMTFRYPSTLKWVNGILPTLEMSTTYHLSIVNNCAAIVAFKAVEPS